MKPVAILQFYRNDGASFLGEHLQRRGVPTRLFLLCGGERAPATLDGFSGLALLGGPMSVNDEWDALRDAEQLVREGVRDEVPLLGHCLGAQLMSRALGGRVAAAPHSEIGWSVVEAVAEASGPAWFGAGRFPMFQWHHEAFTLPPGAEKIAGGEVCPLQAFALQGRHVGLQFHAEIDAAKLASWLNASGEREIAQHAASPGVQSVAAIRAESPARLVESQRVAARLFDRWLQGLRR